jgi:hypothetical protein
MTRENTEADFWQRMDKAGTIPDHCPELGPCWVWQGRRNAAGYGVFSFKGQSYLAHRWAPRGADLRVEAPGQAERRTLLGVLDAASDELLVRTSATQRSSDFIALLGDLDRRYGPAAAGSSAKPVVLVLDHGTIHTSRASQAALAGQRPWLTVEWLPTYAPELNAIERCWRDLKRHYLANRTFRDGDDLDRCVHQAVRQRNLDRARHVWPHLPQAA